MDAPADRLYRNTDMPRERKSISRPQLRSAQDRFVQAWGQMGPSWGISRTMAEVHALLYIGGQPLNTDDVMERLRISRGNASMSLRALVDWGIVSRIHRRGDRKEYFEAEQDAWALARAIIRERLRREILPMLATLYEIRDSTADAASPKRAAGVAASIGPDGNQIPTADELAAHNQRLDRLVRLVQTIDRLAERFVGSEGKGLRAAASILARIV